MMRLLLLFAILLSSFSLTILTTTIAQAQPHPCRCCCAPSCRFHINNCSSSCSCTSSQQKDADIEHITNEFIYHREWLTRIVWEMHLLPAMLLMTEQMTAVTMHQTLAIGMLFDAKHQLETQRLLQSMQAQAHKEYHPSEGVCEFGTNTRALAASDQNAKTNSVVISDYSLQRQLLSNSSISAGGSSSDRQSRWAQFKSTYCNTGDNSNALDAICSAADASRVNKDIDFSKTIAKPYTIEVDFMDGGSATDDETDVFALQSNLYAHSITPNFSDLFFMADRDGNPIDVGSFLYMDTRSLIAQRQVAMASFNALTAMKSQGEENVQPYMKALFEEMGIESSQVDALLGPRPSYYAQMELLTKKLYQNANFYADLYDKPVNVDRKQVAMQAISSIQKRDTYESLLRSEMSQSIWLETQVEKLQEKYENRSRQTTENSMISAVLEGLDF